MSVLGGLADAWLWQRSPTRRVVAWVLAVAGPGLLTLAALPLRSSLVLGGFLFPTLLVVIAVAIIGGTLPTFTTIVLAVLAREFLFAPLRPNLVSLIGFTVAGAAVAVLIGKLAQLAEEQAALLAAAISNADSRAGLTRLAQEQTALRRVATLVARGAPPEDVFTAVSEEAGQLLQAGRTTMVRYESDGTATIVARWSRTGATVSVGAREPLGGTTSPRSSRRPAAPPASPATPTPPAPSAGSPKGLASAQRWARRSSCLAASSAP